MSATPEELKQRIEAGIPGAHADVSGDGLIVIGTASYAQPSVWTPDTGRTGLPLDYSGFGPTTVAKISTDAGGVKPGQVDLRGSRVFNINSETEINAKLIDGALVKKGAALERLRKFDEAIDCYDRAIAADDSMTIAYLYKGGLFNRMERFNEALECYEQALRTQEKV